MNLNQPVLFVPHGAPTFALRPGAAGAALVAKAVPLNRPGGKGVVCAQWEAAGGRGSLDKKLETIHDFWGFPEELYAIRYPATGCPEASREVVAAITAAGLPVATDATRGLDHGAWVPLRLMFPDAEVPVIPLSVQSRGGTGQAYRLGQALAPLAARGFLIIGSGSITHNLGDYQAAWQNGGQTPAYVREFADWLAAQTTAGNLPALLDYRRQAPAGVQAHPSEEHLLPFHVALGAGGENARTTRFHAGIDDCVIAMDAYAFEQGEPQ